VKPETLTFSPKQIIFNEGDETNGIYHVQEGEIEIFRIRENTEVILGTLKSGDVLGTITLFSREARTATARAVTQTVATFYQNEGLAEAFKTLPGWSQAVMKDAINRLKHVNDLLISTKLNEKNLIRNIGTSHHHSAQLANLIASFARKACVMNDVNVPILQMNDFLTLAENILMKKFSYLEKIYKSFIDCGLIKEIEDKKYGKILNVSSTAAFQAGPFMSVYYATKAYVLSFSEALDSELSGSGVNVTVLCPGPTTTGFQSTAKIDASSKIFNSKIAADSQSVALAGYKALFESQRLVIPGLVNKIGVCTAKFAPRYFATSVARWLQGKRT